MRILLSIPSLMPGGAERQFAELAAGLATRGHEVLAVALDGRSEVLSLQVELDGEFHDLHGVAAAPVMFGRQGWLDVVDPDLAEDELALLRTAVEQISIANASVLPQP